MDYGTGAIMSVPAHDDRDHEFAKKYKLEIRLVVLPVSTDQEETMTEPPLPFVAHDGMLINSGPYSGMECADAIKTMSAFAEQNGFGKATVTYRLKDWEFRASVTGARLSRCFIAIEMESFPCRKKICR